MVNPIASLIAMGRASFVDAYDVIFMQAIPVQYPNDYLEILLIWACLWYGSAVKLSDTPFGILGMRRRRLIYLYTQITLSLLSEVRFILLNAINSEGAITQGSRLKLFES
jgi:hypothetical protein